MSAQLRQIVIGVVVGVVLAGIGIAFAASHGGPDTGGLDKRSYTLGYRDAFGGAAIYLHGSRDEIEAECDGLYGKLSRMYGGEEIVRADWVQGCADVAQDKDSRFG